MSRSMSRKPSHLRRSSTTRSIGGRSDIESTYTAGEDEDPFGRPHTRNNSVGQPEEDHAADEHIDKYVSEQLNRLKTTGDTNVHDEFEASLDGTNGH